MCQFNENHDNIAESYDDFVLQGENGLNFLISSMNDAISNNNYDKVIKFAGKIAKIYRSQGNESEAGKYEHEAFVFEQRRIYREAGIWSGIFNYFPNVEILKDYMTCEAEVVKGLKQIDNFVCYKKMIARICRVQGGEAKERDAFWIDESIYPFLHRAKMIMMYKEITDLELEKQCLENLSVKYGKHC